MSDTLQHLYFIYFSQFTYLSDFYSFTSTVVKDWAVLNIVFRSRSYVFTKLRNFQSYPLICGISL